MSLWTLLRVHILAATLEALHPSTPAYSRSLLHAFDVVQGLQASSVGRTYHTRPIQERHSPHGMSPANHVPHLASLPHPTKPFLSTLQVHTICYGASLPSPLCFPFANLHCLSSPSPHPSLSQIHRQATPHQRRGHVLHRQRAHHIHVDVAPQRDLRMGLWGSRRPSRAYWQCQRGSSIGRGRGTVRWKRGGRRPVCDW
ncbi:hypothetical protein JB92DRAFT_46968 [Gautieria morchelliformis]|nr:hypothetical protein JB92DRAFT_46968 [Gautieria morchelliformis]